MEHWRAFSKILGQLPLTIGQRIKLLRTKKPLEIPFSLFLFLKSSLIAVVIIVLKEEPAQPLLKVFSILQQTMMLIVMLGQCGLEFHLWTSSRNSPGLDTHSYVRVGGLSILIFHGFSGWYWFMLDFEDHYSKPRQSDVSCIENPLPWEAWLATMAVVVGWLLILLSLA